MKAFVWSIIIIAFLSFCVYCYHVRTGYNVDKLESQVGSLEQKIRIRDYILSVMPKEPWNEVFFNTIREKFPDVEEDEYLIDIIKLEEEKTGEEKKEVAEVARAKEPKTIDSLIELVVDRFSNMN